MGSLFSKPSLPSPATYSYTPPAPAETVDPAVSEADAEAAASAERAKAIVQKKRTLPQTIETSFRGVLAQADFVPARKSLLGE